MELVERPRKAAPKEVLMNWAEQGARMARRSIDRSFYHRWVVDRSFAWIGHYRRMSKDYERLCATSEAF